MKKLLFGVIGLFVIGLLGCAEITPPSPVEVLKHPWGKGPLRLGMSKEEIISFWGEPDDIIDMGTDEWGAARERWVYRARYPRIPLDAGLIQKAKQLYFEGNVLIKWED